MFLDQALDLLPADYWRWWLAANAPESSDTDFTFARFAKDVNHDLADSFGNLVNRILKFTQTRYGCSVPRGGAQAEAEAHVAEELDRHLCALRRHHDTCALRKAADEVRAIWRLANVYLAAQAPWTLIGNDPERAATVVRTGINLLAAAATSAWAFIPHTATRALAALGETSAVPPWPASGAAALGAIEGGRRIAPLPVLFDKLTAQWVEERERQFAGAEG